MKVIVSVSKYYSQIIIESWCGCSLLLGPEYGTNKNTLKGALDEADHIADVHLTIKNRLLSEVQAEIKEWRNDNYKKQMVGVCKETKTFEDEFHKVICADNGSCWSDSIFLIYIGIN